MGIVNVDCKNRVSRLNSDGLEYGLVEGICGCNNRITDSIK
jgi:hypothetical protein